MSTVDALFLTAAVLVYLLAAYRGVLAVRGRRTRRPTTGLGPLLTMTLALGTALVVLAPGVQALESALVPSLGRLLSNVCTLTAAFGLLHLLLYVRFPRTEVRRRVRTRLVVLLVAVAAMVALFAASSPPTGTGLFGGLYHEQPTLAAYVVVYMLYLAVAITDLAVLSLGSLRQTRRWLRAGMLVLALGCVLTYGYLAEKALGVATEVLTDANAEPYCPGPFATVGCTFAVGIPPIGVLAIIVGASLPTVGPRLQRPAQALRAWWDYWTLQPLSQTLQAELPEVAAATPETPAENLQERRYQRVIVLLDALLVLQPYRSAEDTRRHRDNAHALGLSRRRQAAAVEAADLRAALARHSTSLLSPAEPLSARPQHDDLTSETRWLVRVAREFSRNTVARRQVEVGAES